MLKQEWGINMRYHRIRSVEKKSDVSICAWEMNRHTWMMDGLKAYSLESAPRPHVTPVDSIPCIPEAPNASALPLHRIVNSDRQASGTAAWPHPILATA